MKPHNVSCMCWRCQRDWWSHRLDSARSADHSTTCATCNGRGWHTAAGNDPMVCACPYGEAFGA